MIATVCLEVSIGGWNLIESRQQLALLLPFWCLLWLSAALVMGLVAALPWAVFVASLIVQTHFTFVLLTVVVMVVGVAGLVVAIVGGRTGPRTGPIVLLVTCGVVVVCWAQTVWDQVFGTGNLGTALGLPGGGESAVGLADGVQYIAAATLAPPFWLPGHMGEFLRLRVPIPSSGSAWIASAHG